MCGGMVKLADTKHLKCFALWAWGFESLSRYQIKKFWRDGGTGRHLRLRTWRWKAWEFESLSRYQDLGGMVKLVNAASSNLAACRLVGSSPTSTTIVEFWREAHMAEHSTDNGKEVGSNPTTPTINSISSIAGKLSWCTRWSHKPLLGRVRFPPPQPSFNRKVGKRSIPLVKINALSESREVASHWFWEPESLTLIMGSIPIFLTNIRGSNLVN